MVIFHSYVKLPEGNLKWLSEHPQLVSFLFIFDISGAAPKFSKAMVWEAVIQAPGAQ